MISKLFKKSEKSKGGTIFLLIAVAIFAVTSLIRPDIFIPSLQFSWNILKKIIWVFLLVFVLMALTNYYVSAEKLVKYFGSKKSAKGWLAAIVTGIISSGPIYMWYPLLSDLRKKGVKDGFVAAFLYNRAVKIPLIPVMMFYFGVKFVIVLTVVMIFASVFQGLIVDKLMEI